MAKPVTLYIVRDLTWDEYLIFNKPPKTWVDSFGEVHYSTLEITSMCEAGIHDAFKIRKGRCLISNRDAAKGKILKMEVTFTDDT